MRSRLKVEVENGFTMIEMLFAVMLVGVLTTLSVMTFNQVSHGWQASTEFMDKMQRTDFALNQVLAGLRSMYYPHDGNQDERYGFGLKNNGDGEDVDKSDVIEWSKTGSAIVGTKSSVADTVHRVQVMVLEEGNDDYSDAEGRRVPIEVTGLYARQCPDEALRPKEGEDTEDVDYNFTNAEMYQPVLISDGVVGFNCRILKSPDDAKGGTRHESENDADAFVEEIPEEDLVVGSDKKKENGAEAIPRMKGVPYKIELTFYMVDPDSKGYRSNTAPLMRIIRIPIYEQAVDGATTPDSDEKGAGGAKGKTGGTQRGVGGGGAAPAGGGGVGGGGGLR